MGAHRIPPACSCPRPRSPCRTRGPGLSCRCRTSISSHTEVMSNFREDSAMALVDAEPYEYEFEAPTTALLMIDFQRDFVDPGGFGEALGNDVSLLRRAIAPTRKVLDTARRRDMLVIHTREGHR